MHYVARILLAAALATPAATQTPCVNFVTNAGYHQLQWNRFHVVGPVTHVEFVPYGGRIVAIAHLSTYPPFTPLFMRASACPALDVELLGWAWSAPGGAAYEVGLLGSLGRLGVTSLARGTWFHTQRVTISAQGGISLGILTWPVSAPELTRPPLWSAYLFAPASGVW